MGSYAKQIKEMEEQLKELKKKEKEEEEKKKNQPEYLLAQKLHHILCTANHTDGCSWFYEESDFDSWERTTHKQYLKLAKELLTMEKIVKMAELIHSKGFFL